jgi:site-specific recombinase XerC
MHMHRGRHTAATELQRSQHDLRLTQLLLGHADVRSTARYAQLDTTVLAQALSEQRARKATTKCPIPKTQFAGKVEAAGIEPA